VRDFLQITLDHVDQGIIMVDADLRLVLFNRRARELLDVPADLLARHPTYPEIVYAQIRRGAFVDDPGDPDLHVHETGGDWREGAVQAGTFKRRRPDGAIIEVRTNSLPQGGFVRTFTDVTVEARSAEEVFETMQALAQANAELSESREHLRAILEASPVGVCAMAPGGRIVFANRQLGVLLGTAPEALVGRSAQGLLTDVAEEQRTAERIRADQPLRDVEVRVHRADGSTFWALVSGDPAVLEGKPVYLAWVTDITRRKRIERDMEAARDQAEQATTAKSAFLAAMSHEIRTPMNGVLGMLELLERSRLDGAQADTVATIRESATALLRIIDDILDFSKIEAGRMDLEQEPLSLGALVDGVAEVLAPGARRKGLGFLTFVDPAIPPAVLGDPVRLRQLLFNLAGNAVKFTPSGRVVLRADLVDQDGGTAVVALTVSDTGIGMAPDVLERLFEPFTQAETSTTRRFGGTGLGLSICRRLATLMGGSIGVDSAPGRGSTFRAVLPLPVSAAPALDALGRPLPAEPDLGGVTVLLGVADAQERGFLTRTLEAADAAVLPAPDAATLATRAPQADVAVAEADVLGGAAPPGLPVVRWPFRRAALVRAVAVAAGRASPEPEAGPTPPPAPASAMVPSLDDAAAQGRLILVAEDNPINRKVIRMQLNALGYAAELTADGAEALQALRTGRHALLLTDCHMPEMDGFDLAARVRALEAAQGGPRLPIVAVTANAVFGEAERFQAAGMDACLSKPLDLGQLAAVLARFLPPVPAAAATPTLAEPPPTQTPLDVAVLSRLCAGDDALMREMLDDFVAVSRGIIADLRAALAAGDRAAVRDGAHSLKGSARTAGALPLAAAARALEEEAGTAGRPRLDALAAAVEEALEAVAVGLPDAGLPDVGLPEGGGSLQ